MTAYAGIPQEIEAKLLVPQAATLDAIAQLKTLGPYRLRLRQTAQLHTVYLDTAEFTLARHGVALRLRRNRTRWEASIKWSGRKDGTIHARPELSVPLRRPPVFPFVLLPGSLADQLSELVAGQLLTPILISDVRRQRRAVWVVGQSKAPAFAELALDQVRLSTSDVHRRTAETYYEIEVELEAGGTIADLRNFTELLQERFALTPSDGGKFHRGLALFYGPGLIGSARQRPGARKKTSPPTTQQ